MAKKYCKKSSMKAVADEIRVREGASSTDKVQGSMMYYRIQNLELPVNYGSPNIVLTANNQSHTVLMGKYTGGSVSVVPQNATATLSQNGGYVPIESGKTLASVKVPAKNVKSVATGSLTPSKNATSITVSGLSFRPVGMAVVLQRGSTSVVKPKIGGFIYNNGQINGIAAGGTTYGSYLTSVSASITDNSITLSNFVVSESGSTFTANFINYQVAYMVWG